MKNALLPVSRIPPEVLTLIPDFWDKHDRDQDIIALTHVCRTWRDSFTSRSSLWIDLDCVDANKTRVYLERSKSSSIYLSLSRDNGLLPQDPFLELAPDAFCRLKSLTIDVTPEHLQDFTDYLSHPAPFLEKLDLEINCELNPERSPVLTPALFGGDLSSLRKLRLTCVRTELPWRNMVNLTSFELGYTSSGEISVTQLLDFLESAPHLLEVELYSVTMTYDAQDGRLVTLPRLKSSFVYGRQPTSPLFDHLLIPAGADLTIELDLPLPRIQDYLPGSFDNLRNLSDFTEIRMDFGESYTHMRFAGPNGQVCLVPQTFGFGATAIGLESLALFDTSKTRRLDLTNSDPLSKHLLYQTLLPMKNLLTLTISECHNPSFFFRTLDPSLDPSNVLVCPKLEMLVLCIDRKEGFDFQTVMNMAASRASRGAKLKFVRIESRVEFVPVTVLELRKHVLHVEYDFGVGLISSSDGDSRGESD